MADAKSAALSQEYCRRRLAHSSRGHLACTEGGLPSVASVELDVRDGQLLVASHRRDLAGQVVALSVGRRHRLLRDWNVVVRGRLGSELHGKYPLEIATLDGTTFHRPTTRRTR